MRGAPRTVTWHTVGTNEPVPSPLREEKFPGSPVSSRSMGQPCSDRPLPRPTPAWQKSKEPTQPGVSSAGVRREPRPLLALKFPGRSGEGALGCCVLLRHAFPSLPSSLLLFPPFPPSLPSLPVLPLSLSPSPALSAPDSGLISLGLYPCLRHGLEKLRLPSPIALKAPFLTPSAEILPLGPWASRAQASPWNILSLLDQTEI